VSGTVIPNVPPQFFDNNGAVAAGYKLFTYSAGTTTKINTYSDAALTTPNTNPIVLDSAGRATIFLQALSYKFVLAPPTDTDPPSSPIWTRDNVLALSGFEINVDVPFTAGENVLTNDALYLSAGDGGRTAGRWYKTDADLVYASVSADALGIALAATTLGDSGKVRIIGRVTGLTGITAGAVQYLSSTAGLLTETKPTNPAFAKALAVGDSATSIIVNYHTPRPLAAIDVFTSNGTWTKNPKAVMVQVVCIGGGGGGGSGRRGAAGTDRFGGGGGQGGGYSYVCIPASVCGATEAVTVSTTATGGAGIVADNTNGNNGNAGGASVFGNFIQAAGGQPGQGGTAAAGAGGSGSTSAQVPGGAGGSGSNGVGSNGTNGNHLSAGGGGGAGGINAANVAANGGNGGTGSIARGTPLTSGGGGIVGGTNAGSGGDASVNEPAGGGGGGGGGGTNASQGAGAAGGRYGGGGGGSGAVLNGSAGNAGGTGREGLVIVIQS